MIGMWSEYAHQYLLYFGIGTAVVFCIPLFFAPLLWAKVLLWRAPEDTDLTVYFGRCLGALGLVIDYMVIQAARTGEGVNLVFEGLYIVFALMVVLHVYGALKRIQPITETLEIGFWVGLFFLNMAFHPLVI